MFVLMEANILHADLDAFFASVHQRDDPSLRGKPVAVGGGVVMAASYEAKACGVRSAMGGATARRLCPDLVVVTPEFDAYVEASKAVFEIFRDTAPYVEGISIDEAFLDVSGLERISGTPPAIAARLRKRVRAEVGLAITVGVARTKHLAKVASASAKPDGLLVVPPDREIEFLHPLPVERLWGVGAVTAEKLHARGLTRVGELAALGEDELIEILGRASGRHVHSLANNRDPRQVDRVRRRRRSMGAQRALGRRMPRSRGALDAVLVGLIDKLTQRMRGAHRVCRTVVLRLRFGDFTRATRSQTVAEATAETEILLTAARELLDTAMPLIEDQGITLLGVSLTNLANDDAVQLALPLERQKARVLDATIDDVRERFGNDAITRAVLIGRDKGFSMPGLPD
jgi:DNA polymerase-4